MYPEYAKFILFSNFMMIFAYITPIFAGLRICSKIDFPWNFKGPRKLDEGSGAPTCYRKGSPGNTWPPKKTDKCLRTSGTVVPNGNKINSSNKILKKRKITQICPFFGGRAPLYLVCADTAFFYKPLLLTYLCLAIARCGCTTIVTSLCEFSDSRKFRDRILGHHGTMLACWTAKKCNL